MRRREHLKQGLHAWQPKKYRALMAKKYPEILGTAGIWLLLSLALMLVVALPKIMGLGAVMEERLSSFETFSIETNISLRTPIILSSTPSIIINPEQENLSAENVLINNKGIVVKRAFWQGTKTTPWSTILDIPAHASTYASWLGWAFILLLPTIILVISIAFVIEASLLVLACVVFGRLISKLSRFTITFGQLLKVATIATIPLMSLQIIPLFYLRWWLVPVSLYLLLFFAASWMVGESRFERQRH